VDHVEYARVRDINFTSAKKMKAELNDKIANLCDEPVLDSSPQPSAVKEIPEPHEGKK